MDDNDPQNDMGYLGQFQTSDMQPKNEQNEMPEQSDTLDNFNSPSLKDVLYRSFKQLTPDILQNLLLATKDAPTDSAPTENNFRGSWSSSEDALLTEAINKLGENKWTSIAQHVGTRSAKQCRERWTNCLKPGLKREPFTPSEDAIILEQQARLGNRWASIAKFLPGRSPGAVKNRWYTGLRTMHAPQTQLILPEDQNSTISDLGLGLQQK